MPRRLLAAVVALLLLGAGALAHVVFILPLRDISGVVVDGATQQPLAGVQVAAPGGNALTGHPTTQTDARGHFTLSRVAPDQALSLALEGYRPGQAPLPPPEAGALRVALEPYILGGAVLAADSGAPVAAANVAVGERTVATGADGAFRLAAVAPGAAVQVSAPGYRPATLAFDPAAPASVHLEPYIFQGTLRDAADNTPVAGAVVSAAGRTATTGADGAFRLVAVPPGTSVAVSGPGFKPTSLTFQPGPDGAAAGDIRLEARTLAVTVVNQWTGQAVGGAEVAVGGASQRAGAEGTLTLRRVEPTGQLRVQAPGFAAATLPVGERTEARVELRPDTVTGTITAKDGKPLANATVRAGEATATTDAAGRFSLAGLAEGATLAVRKEGYTPVTIDPRRQPSVAVALEPRPIRASYLTFYGVGSEELLNNAIKLVETTEINALVIDVKGDRGWISYKSKVPLVAQIGAQQEITIPDAPAFIRAMKARDVYLIARIVTFKDTPLALARPHLAIQDRNTGRPWRDGEELAWIDAFQEEAWDYNIALAKEAAELGFDEIQFDYIRFPTDPGVGTSLEAMKLAKENTRENRVAAIAGFLRKARAALEPTGAVLAIDVFGYVSWRTDDMSIGQHLETIGQIVDVICTMTYPNLFWDGVPVNGEWKYNDRPGAYPYEIVYESMKITRERLAASGARAQVRPWLQYYNDYIDDIPYGDREVRLQKKAVYDNGITGWMFWDPTNWFRKGGFDPQR